MSAPAGGPQFRGGPVQSRPAFARAPLRIGPQRAGIVLALAAMLMFALNDTLGKWLMATASVGQVLVVRSAAALLLLVPLIVRSRTRLWPLPRRRLQVVRVLGGTADTLCFYMAVALLPLADVMTYWLAAPIYVAALSPWLLDERIGRWRWVAIVVGFIGVVVALDPGAQRPGAGLAVCIVGSLGFAVMLLTGRMLRRTPDLALVFWQMVGAAAAGLGLAVVPGGWPTASPGGLALIALLGVVATLAHLLVVRALKLGDAAAIAPTLYTLLFWGAAFGWLVFGDVPTAPVATGAALIVAAGLVIWLRETRAARRAEAG